MQHFSHPHQLHDASNTVSRNKKTLECFGNKLPLSGTCYACSRSSCNFYLHKFCFDLPRYAHLNSHPEHTLTLKYPLYSKEGGRSCDACDETCNGFTYNCTLCNYNVHANCATFPHLDRDQCISTVSRHKDPVKSTEEEEEEEEEDDATEMEIKRLTSKLESLLKLMQKQKREEEEAYAIRMLEKMEEESRKRWDNLHRSRVKMAMQQVQRYESSSDFLGRL